MEPIVKPWSRFRLFATAFCVGWSVMAFIDMSSKLFQYQAIMEQQDRDDELWNKILDAQQKNFHQHIRRRRIREDEEATLSD